MFAQLGHIILYCQYWGCYVAETQTTLPSGTPANWRESNNNNNNNNNNSNNINNNTNNDNKNNIYNGYHQANTKLITVALYLHYYNIYYAELKN